jgi:hypothetical protein
MENKVVIEEYQSYCNLELLQLLYEKGFRFKIQKDETIITNNLAEQRFNEGDISYCEDYIPYSVIIEWLRVNHGIWVQCSIYRRNPNDYIGGIYYNKYDSMYTEPFNSPEEVYESSFQYVLNNLIK